MMSLETIHHLAREQAARAARDNQEPYMIHPDDLLQWFYDLNQGVTPRLPFPNLGDYRPAGWKLVDTIFCDKTGMDNSGPAMGPGTLIKQRLKPGHGYAIVEEGQFQLYVGEFERDEDEPASEDNPDPDKLVFCESCEEEHLLDDDGTCGWCGENPFGEWVDGEYVTESN